MYYLSYQYFPFVSIHTPMPFYIINMITIYLSFMNYHWSHYFSSVNIQSPIFDNICVLLMKETQQNQNNDNNNKNFNQITTCKIILW